MTSSRQTSPPIPMNLALGGALAIVLLTFLAYWPAINAGFIWDDDQYVTSNALLHDLDGLRRIWIPRQTPQYYPVVFTTFWIEHQLWQLNAMGYHIVNVLLHALNALLVWRIALKLLPLPAIGLWLIAAVFALHPVHVESVAWITERKNVLSGFFYLLAMLAYLRFDEQNDVHSRRWPWYALSLILFVLALLSKSVTCSLPAAMILIMLYQRKTLGWSRIVPLGPMFIIGLVSALHTAKLEREHVLAIGPDFAFSFADRILIASNALLFYPAKLLWPQPLIFVYPRWTIDDHDVLSYWPVVLDAVIAVAAIIAYRRGRRGPALAAAFFAGTIFPALGFFNIYPMVFSFVADHFQYLASLGIIVLVVGGVCYFVRDFNRIATMTIIILPMLGWITWNQSRQYTNLETLWLSTLARNKEAWLAHNNLVPILLTQSQIAQSQRRADLAAQLLDKAVFHGSRAVEIKDNDLPSRSNYSQALAAKGRYGEALVQIERALELDPTQADYHWQQAYLHQMLGHDSQAERGYRRALELDENSILFRASLTEMLVRRGDALGSASHIDRLLLLTESSVVTLGPNEYVVLDSLARVCAQVNRFDDAVRIQSAALDVAKRNGMRDQVLSAERKLKAYQSGRKQ